MNSIKGTRIFYQALKSNEEDESIRLKLFTKQPVKELVINTEVVGKDGQQGPNLLFNQFAQFNLNGYNKIEIGDSADAPYERLVCNTTYDSTMLKMEGASILKLESESDNPYSTPFVHMKGLSYIDISGGEQSIDAGGGAIRSLRQNENAAIKEVTLWDLFNNESSYQTETPYPAIMMHGSPTVIMEGVPLFKMEGASAVTIKNGADIRVGGLQSGENNLSETGCSQVIIDGGIVHISSKISTQKPFLSIVNEGGPAQQIFFSTAIDGNTLLDTNVPGTIKPSPTNPRLYPIMTTSPQIDITGTGGIQRQCPYIYDKVTTLRREDIVTQYVGDGASFLLQGHHTNMVLGDNGNLGIRIAPENGGTIYFDWTEDYGAFSDVKIGGGEGAQLRLDATSGDGSVSYYRIGAANGTTSTVVYQPSGVETSLNFSPYHICGIAFTPKDTDIVCQWDRMQGIFEGTDTFYQVEDYAHGEMLGGASLIMRGREPISASVDNNNYISFITTTDYTGQHIEDLSISDYQTFINKLENPSDSMQRSHYLEDSYYKGSITSTMTTDKPYNIVINGLNMSESTSYRSGSIGFNADSGWNFTTLADMSRANNPLLARLKELCGQDIQIIDIQIDTSNSYIRNYTSSSFYVIYFTRLSINNIQSSFTSATQYALNLSFSELPSTDQNNIINTVKRIFNSGSTGLNIEIATDTAKVIENDFIPNLQYKTVITNFKTILSSHLDRDWERPVKQFDKGSNVKKMGPIMQTYDESNFVMRGAMLIGDTGINVAINTVKNYNLIARGWKDGDTTYPSTNSEPQISKYRKINYLQNNQTDYDSFEQLLQEIFDGQVPAMIRYEGYKLVNINSITDVSSTESSAGYDPINPGSHSITINITIRKKEFNDQDQEIPETRYLSAFRDSPLIETIGPCELKLNGKVSLKLEENYGNPIITISNNSDEVQEKTSVSFTLEDLIKLRAIIDNGGGIPIVEVTQSEYDNMESHDQNTLYAIPEGGL